MTIDRPRPARPAGEPPEAAVDADVERGRRTPDTGIAFPRRPAAPGVTAVLTDTAVGDARVAVITGTAVDDPRIAVLTDTALGDARRAVEPDAAVDEILRSRHEVIPAGGVESAVRVAGGHPTQGGGVRTGAFAAPPAGLSGVCA